MCVLTHGGRAQREAMASMGVFELRPDLFRLFHTIMAALGSAFAAALVALGGEGQGGGGGGAGAGAG